MRRSRRCISSLSHSCRLVVRRRRQYFSGSALTVDFEKLAPHSYSMIAVTWRVDTPCTTISILSASTNACSLLR